MRPKTFALALIIILGGSASIVQSASDDVTVLEGNQAEVSAWLIGDWWEYELGGGVDAMGMTVSASGDIRFEVTEIMTQNIGGIDYLLYNVSLSGSFTGSGSGTVQGVDVDVIITSATLGGFWWVERGDLAVIVDNETIDAIGTVVTLFGTFPLTLNAEIENRYTPSREDFDFPIEVGDQWDLSTSMTTSGYVYYFIDSIIPIEDTIPLDSVTPLTGTSVCNQKTAIVVPAGSFDSFEASFGVSDERWYSESVGYMVKWESHGGMGMFGDIWVNLTSFNRVSPFVIVDEFLLPQKVNPGGSVVVNGSSSAAPSSEVRIKIPATGDQWITNINASGGYALSITAPTTADNTPTPTDIGSHGVLVEVTDGPNIGYAVRSLTIIQPDLYVLNVSFSPTPTDGNPTTISAEVHCGPEVGVMNQILVTFLVDGQLLGNNTTPFIDASSAAIVQQVWVATIGLHDVTVTVDPLDSIDEYNELNNSDTVQVFVLGPDLAPTDISVEDSVSYYYPSGEPFGHVSNVINVLTGEFVNITTNVTNAGLSFSTEQFDISIYETSGLGGPQMGPPLMTEGPLAPMGQNESQGPFKVTWNVPLVEGMYYFNITVDTQNNLTEMSEVNNTFILRFNVILVYPDLYITPSDISIGSQPYLGNPVAVYADVHANTNRSVTGSFIVSFLSDGQLIGNDTVSSIPAGGVVNTSVMWNPDVGTHILRVDVDPLNLVGESDESNNSAEMTIDDPWPDLAPHDIVVRNGAVYSYPDPEVSGYVSEVIMTYAGQRSNLSLNVTNFGASFFNVEFRVQFHETDGLGGLITNTFYDSGPLSSLGTGNSHGPLAVDWYAPSQAGDYNISMTVDVDDTVEESSESNNTFYLMFFIEEPDDVDYVPVPTFVSPIKTPIGSSVNLTVRAENQGTTSASASTTMAFYEQGNPSTPLFEDVVLPLDAGGFSSHGFDWTPPGLGTYVLEIAVDFYNDVPETNESNNVVDVTIVVTALPDTSISFGSPKHGQDSVYVSSSTEFRLSAVDHSGEGIAKIYYWIDDPPANDYLVTGNFTLTGEGLHTISYYSVDNIGGIEATHSLSVFVDNTPPTTELSYDGEVVRPSTDLILNAADDGSGVASTWYRIDSGQWLQYSIPFILEEGSHNVTFYSIDNLGNEEPHKWRQLEVGERKVAEEPNYKLALSIVLAVVLDIIGLLLCLRPDDSNDDSQKRNFLSRVDWKSYLMVTMPFIFAELVVGVLSFATGHLRVPPVLGEGMIVDLVILIVGILVAFIWNRREASKQVSVD